MKLPCIEIKSNRTEPSQRQTNTYISADAPTKSKKDKQKEIKMRIEQTASEGMNEQQCSHEHGPVNTPTGKIKQLRQRKSNNEKSDTVTHPLAPPPPTSAHLSIA